MILIDTILLSGNPTRDSEFHHSIKNSTRVETSAGELHNYIGGPEYLTGVLIIDRVPKEEAEAFRAWLRQKNQYGRKSFTLTPPEWEDFGFGEGNPVPNCMISEGVTSTSKLLKRNKRFVNKYTITLPYRAEIGSSGVGDMEIL